MGMRASSGSLWSLGAGIRGLSAIAGGIVGTFEDSYVEQGVSS